MLLRRYACALEWANVMSVRGFWCAKLSYNILINYETRRKKDPRKINSRFVSLRFFDCIVWERCDIFFIHFPFTLLMLFFCCFGRNLIVISYRFWAYACWLAGCLVYSVRAGLFYGLLPVYIQSNSIWSIDLTCNQSTTWIPHRLFVLLFFSSCCCCCFGPAGNSFNEFFIRIRVFLHQLRWSKSADVRVHAVIPFVCVPCCWVLFAFILFVSKKRQNSPEWMNFNEQKMIRRFQRIFKLMEGIRRNIIDRWLAIEWIVYAF